MCRHEGPVWQGSGSFKNSSGSGSSEEVAPEGAEAILKNVWQNGFSYFSRIVE